MRSVLLVLLFAGVASANPHPHSQTDAPETTNIDFNTTSGGRGGTLQIDQDAAASSAASIDITPCTNGASGQGPAGGGALGLSDPFCKIVAAIYVAQALCATMPMVPVECGGGGEMPEIEVSTGVPIDTGTITADCNESNGYCGTAWDVPEIPRSDVYIINPTPIECFIVNPACGDGQALWIDAQDLIRAELGAGGWRAKLGAWLPNFIRWLF